MKQTLILFLIFAMISCKEETSNEVINEQSETQTVIQEESYTTSYQIDFDEVEYYSFEKLDIGQLLDIEKRIQKTERKKKSYC